MSRTQRTKKERDSHEHAYVMELFELLTYPEAEPAALLLWHGFTGKKTVAK